MSGQRKLELAACKVPYLQQIAHELVFRSQYLQERALQKHAPTATRRNTHLDDPISRAGSKPVIARLNRDASHPAQVPRDDAHELPRGVVRGLDGARLLVERERLREVRRARQ
jgi:hypothetical protein